MKTLNIDHAFASPPQRFKRALASSAFALAMLWATGASATPNDETLWRERYAQAKTTLESGHPAEAAQQFAALAAEAPTPEEAALVRELLAVARETAHRTDPAQGAHIRTGDELSVLYASAFIYGLGSGAWVVLQTKPGTFAVALLPFVAFTATAVGGVAVVDNYRPFRRGVPHSIAAGLYLGLGEGFLAVGMQHSVAARRDDDSRWGTDKIATALWAGATVGGVAGGVIGYLREPTPGRVSFTASTGTWSGLVAGFAGAAIESRERSRAETGFVVGAVGYNLGIVGGIMVAPLIAPSISRVRFGDLGTVGGGLLASGAYAIAAQDHATVRGGLGFAALGAAGGFGLTWWLTRGMPSDPPKETASPSVHALVTPTQGGFIVGLGGEL